MITKSQLVKFHKMHIATFYANNVRLIEQSNKETGNGAV